MCDLSGSGPNPSSISVPPGDSTPSFVRTSSSGSVESDLNGCSSSVSLQSCDSGFCSSGGIDNSVEPSSSSSDCYYREQKAIGTSSVETPKLVVGLNRSRHQSLSRVQKSSAKVFGLSPVSEIAVNLKDATLDTPKSRREGERGKTKGISTGLKTLLASGANSRKSNLDQQQQDNIQKQPLLLESQPDFVAKVRKEAATDTDGRQDGVVSCSDKHSCEFFNTDDKRTSKCLENDGCISTTFTINSTGRSPASRLAEQRQRSAQRRQFIAPLRMDNKFLGSPGKENLPTEEELSFYHGNSPQPSPRPCSPCECPEEPEEMLASEITPNKQTIAIGALTGSAIRTRRPLEDYDPNSMDSGYGASVSSGGHKSQSLFTFVQPSIPRQNSSVTASPASAVMRYSLSSGSMESMDDIDMDLFEMDSIEDDAQLPSNLNSLICGDIKATKTTPENKKPFVRRCLSLSETPVVRRVKSNLLFDSPVTSSNSPIVKTPERYRPSPDQENLNLTPFSSRSDATRCFKRPEPPGVSPVQSKRHKPEVLTPVSSLRSCLSENISLDSPASLTVPPKRPLLQKSISMNDAQIMKALSRSSSEPDLIGDFSKSYILPLTEGRHRDLKSISPQTMAELVRGAYDHKIASYKIIDCRYPYEFEGGHIRGARNLYTQDQILEELIRTKSNPPKVEADAPKRDVIVFHCEFSSERGPKLSRFLRNHDRILNSDSYPALHYPEIYLLHGGYKDFFAVHPELCDPIAYREMLDPAFGDAYRHFRAKSKSWNGDVIKGSAMPHSASFSSSTSSSSSEGGFGSGRIGGSRLVKSRSRLVL
ncbi:M-phase inducer phosphatase 2-like [Uranotaenia lowii]|uniref:M-phase inducer phosphatase 2-like n=1 Tax=Uranotaenia lowii TaxID=190385 RepID=UPI00247A3F5D|nr:M-phase inducer phosphatase 2-like [Uranotaenia lowii]